jgi:hypothetical protein
MSNDFIATNYCPLEYGQEFQFPPRCSQKLASLNLPSRRPDTSHSLTTATGPQQSGQFCHIVWLSLPAIIAINYLDIELTSVIARCRIAWGSCFGDDAAIRLSSSTASSSKTNPCSAQAIERSIQYGPGYCSPIKNAARRTCGSRVARSANLDSRCYRVDGGYGMTVIVRAASAISALRIPDIAQRPEVART